MPVWGRIVLLLCAWVAWGSASDRCLAAPSVWLEMVTEQGVPPTAPQQWLATLKDCGFDNLRIRQGELGDRVGLETRGDTHHVVGILTAGGVLHLPGGKFTLRDRAAIGQWVERLRGGGEAGLTDRPAAFGLTGRQLVALHESLATPVPFATRGKPTRDVVEAILRTAAPGATYSAPARAALAGNDLVGDELRGVSAGTALAAALRPLGLVLVPQRDGQGVRLSVVEVREATESWPVGWPPEKDTRDLLPKLLEFLTVEINDIPLTDALDAIVGRLETPLLWDHNSLARQRIEPEQIKVSLPEGKTFYKRVLDRLLGQAKLTMEVRVDEAGRPLLWISTLKR